MIIVSKLESQSANEEYENLYYIDLANILDLQANDLDLLAW